MPDKYSDEVEFLNGILDCRCFFCEYSCPFSISLCPYLTDNAYRALIHYVTVQFSSSTRQTFGVMSYCPGKRFVTLT